MGPRRGAPRPDDWVTGAELAELAELVSLRTFVPDAREAIDRYRRAAVIR